jgi:uncharacterized protein (DUF1778 family)
MEHMVNNAGRQVLRSYRLRFATGRPYAIVIQNPERRIMTTLVLSVRVNEEERALLEAASALARTSLSDFIRRKALDAAEADVLERRIVTIPAKDWEAFETWANRAPEEIDGLKELARKAPVWQK